MRVLSIFTDVKILLVLQQLVSIWFLFDFFLTRDSLTADNLWKSRNRIDNQPVRLLAEQVKEVNCQDSLEPLFEKVILIVIDALGSEFIPSLQHAQASITATMPFLEESIRAGKAMGFTARAATPTVTMPRIKALVSGTIPSFTDVVYNLASDVSKFNDDNILKIARAQNKSIVFYGDDTWLSLFDKGIFTRYQETLSFFASDYTTVDTNVTERALPETLDHTDWDFLVLHYLGLDHIGHVFGSNTSPLINEKLIEMDMVIKNITENISKLKQRTLIVICGDHGMGSNGNHGGSSDLESDTAMIFLPVNFKYNYSDLPNPKPLLQIDMAVTISLLTGMEIPKMSKGVAIEPVLNNLISKEGNLLACAALKNVIQLVDLMDTSEFNSSSEHKELIDLLKSHKLDIKKKLLSNDYFELARRLQTKLLKTIASNSNPFSLVLALTSVSFLSILRFRRISIQLLVPVLPKKIKLACLLIFVIPILMVGSTDFIENEQIFWPIFSLLSFVILSLIVMNSSARQMKDLDTLKLYLFIISFLITTFWNRLRWLRDDFKILSNLLSSISVLILCNSIRQLSLINKSRKAFLALVGVMILLTKQAEESTDESINIQYRAVIQRLAILTVTSYHVINLGLDNKLRTDSSSTIIPHIASAWMCFAFLFARKCNLFYLIANLIMEKSVNSITNSLKLPPVSKVIIYVHFAQSAFYNQGNTNLFTSIDIWPAFYGQTSYNIYLSVPLAVMATYSAQIYWYIMIFHRMHGVKTSPNNSVSNQDISMKTIRYFITTRNFLSLAYYMFVCLVLKNHLFIWSVISPKLLYHFVSNKVLLLTVLLISNVHNPEPTIEKTVQV